jgi:magnesium chelatase subunit D
VRILERRIQFESDPEGFCKEWEPYEWQLTQEITRARESLPRVTYAQTDLYQIAELTTSFQVDGHRADIVILKTALAHAAYHNRQKIAVQDIIAAAELTLPHRLKSRPFEDTELQTRALEDQLEQVRSELAGSAPVEDDGAGEPSTETAAKKNDLSATDTTVTSMSSGGTPLRGHHVSAPPLEAIRGQEVPVPIGPQFKPRRLQTPLDRLTRRTAGRRSSTRTNRKRGRYIQARPAHERSDDIAFDATIRAAAPYQLRRQSSQNGGTAFSIHKSDLHRKVRVRRAANLILFVVDASWSMAAAERMAATKGAIMSLLRDAYQHRDQVGLVVFQKDRARLALRPTSSVDLAEGALKEIPVGGKTPLSSGLLLAYRVISRELRLNPETMPLLILLTDGAGNVAMTDLTPREEALRTARLLRRKQIHSIVINMEHPSFDRGLAQELADALDAPCYCLPEIQAQMLYQAVQDELK